MRDVLATDPRDYYRPGASRPATVLLAFCILVLVSIWLLNVSIHKGRRDYYSGLQRLEARAKTLDRLQEYRAKNANFYRHIMRAALLSQHFETPMWPDWGTTSFGDRASAIISENPQVEIRKEELLRAMKEYVVGEGRFTNSYYKYLAGRLSVVDSPEEWPSIAHWIVFDQWPDARFEAFGGDRDRVSYTNRYTRIWGLTEEDRLLSRRLILEGEKNAEVLLSKEYFETANRLAIASRNSNQIGLSGLGVSIPVGDLLFFVGPTLVALAAVFVIVRERGFGTAINKEFSFPQYRSPNDPLLEIRRCGVGDCAERALWGVFLILPVLVLTIGFLFRYDIATPLDIAGRLAGLVPTAMELKVSDSVDNALDGVNLICVAILLLFVYTLTARPDRVAELARYRKWAGTAWGVSAGLATLCAGMVIWTVFVWKRPRYVEVEPSGLEGYPLYCVVAFVLILLAGACAGVRRRLRFLTLVCIILLVALAMSVLAGPEWGRIYPVT